MERRESAAGRRARLPVAAQLGVAVLLGAATWGAWLGWDHSYYPGPDGVPQGPYRPAQVVGCAVTVALVTALPVLRWNPFAVAGGVSAGFWLVWTVDAAATDETGLFVVGAVLLAFGLVAGTSVCAALGYVARAPVRRWRPPQPGR